MDADTQAFYKEVGRRLARRRRLVGLRQAEVAKALGWHRPHLSGWEHGKYQAMKLDQLAKLAEVLKTSTEYLLLRVEDDPGEIPPARCLAERPDLEGTAALPAISLLKGETSA